MNLKSKVFCWRTCQSELNAPEITADMNWTQAQQLHLFRQGGLPEIEEKLYIRTDNNII